MSTTRQAIDQALATARRLGAARHVPNRSARAFDRLSADIDAAGVVLGPDSTDRLGSAMERNPAHEAALKACRLLVLAFADGEMPARWGNWGKVCEAWRCAVEAMAPQD